MLMFFLEFSSSITENQIVDEGVHLLAGYSYLKTHSVYLNPEHPPLIKLLQAAPLLLLQPSLPKLEEQWGLARKFLYSNSIPADTMLLAGRIVTMILSLILGWFIFQWASQSSPKRGLLALFLYAFDSTILAHSHYITTDIGVTLFMFLTIFYLHKFDKQPKNLYLFLTGLFFALAMLSKFSAILLVPMILFIGLMTKISFKNYCRIIISCFSCFFIFLPVFYFLNPTAYLEGCRLFLGHVSAGHPAYLLGERSQNGWWYYFPAAFIIKISPVILILLTTAVSLNIKNLFRKYIFLVAPILIYFCASMLANINIGIRHLLPVYPFIFVFIAVAIPKIRILPVLLLAYFLGTVLIFPNFIAYFSPLFGGQAEGHKYLLDSNIDWGQDLIKLRDYLTENDINEPIYLYYFGQAQPDYYIKNVRGYSDEEKVTGYFAISVNNLYISMLENFDFAWLSQYTPIKIGSSLLLYKIDQ